MHPAARVLRQLTLQSTLSPRQAAASAAADDDDEVAGDPSRIARHAEDGNSSGYEEEAELFSDAVSDVAEAAPGAVPTQGKYSQKDVDDMAKDMQRQFQLRWQEKERGWEKLEREQTTLLAAREDEADRLRDKCASLKSIVGEYERSMAELISERDYRPPDEPSSPGGRDDAAYRKVAQERDQLLVDLRGVEASFADLHRRYEKVKESVEGYRKNEELLKGAVAEHRAALERSEQRYRQLHDACEQRLSAANEAFERTRRAAEADVARVQAALKKSELRIQSLQTQLQQKNQECAELTAICDELIAKIGSESK